MCHVVDCLLMTFCFKQHQTDMQTLADRIEQQQHQLQEQQQQLQQQSAVIHSELLKPPNNVYDDDDRVKEPEMEMRMENDVVANAERGSHSPAHLEELSIDADVHEGKRTRADDLPQAVTSSSSNHERFSGVAFKDEIEIFTDVELGNGARYSVH
ncbi:uncharacterized protein LOC127565640 isoform X2 [Drosophila albomicans]|uniref:Uncharacterized protein LOC127565640 isoform X2 n=1 Tax=Drosophila albomicans TaxID=7291 RepID=A0A9C6SWH9_DROAB|nr:uncharacterized protein LOC127565640 isoform X2 [Drosophila albomicans]